MDPLTNTYYGVPHLRYDPRGQSSRDANEAVSPAGSFQKPEEPDRNYSDKVAVLSEDGRDYSDKMMVFRGPQGTMNEPSHTLASSSSQQSIGGHNRYQNVSKAVARKPVGAKKSIGNLPQTPSGSFGDLPNSDRELYLQGLSILSPLRIRGSAPPISNHVDRQEAQFRPHLGARSATGGPLPYPNTQPQPLSHDLYASQQPQRFLGGRLPYPEDDIYLPQSQVSNGGSAPSILHPQSSPWHPVEQQQRHSMTSPVQRMTPTPFHDPPHIQPPLFVDGRSQVNSSPHVQQQSSFDRPNDMIPSPQIQQRAVLDAGSPTLTAAYSPHFQWPSASIAGSQSEKPASSPVSTSPSSPTIPTSPPMSPTNDNDTYYSNDEASPARDMTTFAASSVATSGKTNSQFAQAYRPVSNKKNQPLHEPPWSPETYHNSADQVPSYEQAIRSPFEHTSPTTEAGPSTVRTRPISKAPPYASLRTQSGYSDRVPVIIQAARENRLDIIQANVANGVDIDTVDTRTQRHALSEASSLGYGDIVGYLIFKGCNLEQKDRDGNNALHLAVLSNHSQIVKILLATNSFPINGEGQRGESALFMACNTSYNNTISHALLQSGANPNLRDHHQRTPLHNAAARGITSICSLLLECGAEVSPLDHNSQTPLHQACSNGHAAIVLLLLPLTPHPKPNSLLNLSPFFAALSSGFLPCAAPFLNDSKIVSLKKLKSTDGYKPLHLVAASGNVSLLYLILSHKASLKDRDPSGLTALHAASAAGHAPIITILLSKCLSPKIATSKKKELPLHLALRAPHPAATFALLADKSCPVSARDKDSHEPLHHCARHGLFDLASTLLDRGAAVSTESNYGWKPIHLASAYGHARLVELFLAHGAKVDDKLGETKYKPKRKTLAAVRDGYVCEARWPHPGSRALGLALEFGRCDVVRLVLERGAKIEERDAEGWRALHYAAWSGNADMLGLLLRRGAYPHALTAKGNSAVAVGVREGAEEGEVVQVRALLEVATGKTKKGVKESFSEAMKVGRKEEEDRNASWMRARIAEELDAKEEGADGEDEDGDEEDDEEGRVTKPTADLQVS